MDRHVFSRRAGPTRVVLFDLDGTLLDTTPLVRASTHYALRSVAGTDVADEVLTPYLGRTLETQFRGLFPDADDALVDRLVRAYRTHNDEVHDRSVAPMPGAREAVGWLRGQGIALGVVSSKRRLMVERGLRWLGLEDAFTVVVGVESTTRHKPDPDPLELALGHFPGVSPAEAVMVGDSPYDMAAARAARIDGVAVLGNTFTHQDLVRAGAVAVLATLFELPAWIRPDLGSGGGL
ncbi:MAG: HAD family hydrolase [Clostridia bacterium]